MELISEYLRLTKVCALTDYSNKQSVKVHNKAISRMYEIVEKIGSEMESIHEFSNLLDINTNNTNIWTAVQMLEKIPLKTDIE